MREWSPAIVYSIDRADRIDWVNPAWDLFAEANGAPQLRGTAVIGSSLWSHISDLTLSHLLQKLFAKVRSSRQPLVLRCRCDAPAIRRELEVYLESRDGISVVVVSTVTFEMHRVVTPRRSRSAKPIRMCSWCNAIDVEGQWLELEVAARELGLMDGPEAPLITHTLCHRCETTLRTAVE